MYSAQLIDSLLFPIYLSRLSFHMLKNILNYNKVQMNAIFILQFEIDRTKIYNNFYKFLIKLSNSLQKKIQMQSRKNKYHKFCRRQNLNKKFNSIRQELLLYQQTNNLFNNCQKKEQVSHEKAIIDNTIDEHQSQQCKFDNFNSFKSERQSSRQQQSHQQKRQSLNISNIDIQKYCETIQGLLKQCDDTNIKNLVQTAYLIEKIIDSYQKVFIPSYKILEALILKKNKSNSQLNTIFCIWNFLCFVKVCIKMHEFQQIQSIMYNILNAATILPILRYVMNIGRKVKLEAQQILIEIFENFQSSTVLLTQNFVQLFLIEQQFQSNPQLNSLQQEENQALINLWLAILRKKSPQKFAETLNYTNIFHKCIIGCHFQFATTLLSLTQAKLGKSHELYQAEKQNFQAFIMSLGLKQTQQQFFQHDAVCRRTCHFDFGQPFS